MEAVEKFYDDFADYYHLIFEDWHEECHYQAGVLHQIISERRTIQNPQLLDVTCGIGTQALGLASLGYTVTGVDISQRCLERAKAGAAKEKLSAEFVRGDVRNLSEVIRNKFDVVISCDNSLSHLLTDDDIFCAFREMRKCTNEAGICIATIRDYENEPRAGRVFRPYGIRQLHNHAIMVFQVWEFIGQVYDLYWYLVDHDPSKVEPSIQRFKTQFYAVPVATVMRLMEEAGFANVTLLNSDFYQPVIVAEAK